MVNYYLKHSGVTDFEEHFLNFTKWLFANLCSRYIVTPTVNAVKQNILNLNAETINNKNRRPNLGR